jgi:membrane-associated protease RseP (regulator of RpoE activity)
LGVHFLSQQCLRTRQEYKLCLRISLGGAKDGQNVFKVSKDKMEFWILIFLGLITYLMVQRVVTSLTKTPVWLLWLVLMIPPTVWVVSIAKGQQAPPPSWTISSVAISTLLYILLFMWGRRPPSPESSNVAKTPKDAPIGEPLQILPIIPEPVPVRALEASEETQLRECFSWSVYFLQNIEYRPQAVICRGQLRTDPAEAYEKIKENIQEKFSDRFIVIFQEGLNGKPFFVLVPNPQLARDNPRAQEKLTRPGLALVMLFATLLTTTFVGMQVAGFKIEQVQSQPRVFLAGLQYALPLMTILGLHELGHYFTSLRYKIRSTLPYFIPMPLFLGTFGAFIQMRSPIPNRKALFDVGIAGPFAGFVATLPFFVWGLAHSEIISASPQPGLLSGQSLNALNPQYSILVAIIAKIVLGAKLTSGSAIALHPVAVAGVFGLIVTALNLMPVGQLDGGHIIHAMFGQRNALIIGQVARFLLLLISLVQPEFFLWAIIVLFIPLMDEPALNDVTDLDNQRDLWGLAAMALLVSIILPLPEVFARMLNI